MKHRNGVPLLLQCGYDEPTDEAIPANQEDSHSLPPLTRHSPYEEHFAQLVSLYGGHIEVTVMTENF
jgi:hypothetical protein